MCLKNGDGYTPYHVDEIASTSRWKLKMKGWWWRAWNLSLGSAATRRNSMTMLIKRGGITSFKTCNNNKKGFPDRVKHINGQNVFSKTVAGVPPIRNRLRVEVFMLLWWSSCSLMHSPGDGTYINISSKQYFFIKGWVQDSIQEGGGGNSKLF